MAGLDGNVSDGVTLIK